MTTLQKQLDIMLEEAVLGRLSVQEDACSSARPKLQQSYQTTQAGVIRGNPKYPKFSSLEARINSFRQTNWRQQNISDIDELVQAGFVYTGQWDSVTCYFCDLNIRRWESRDCPWEQHALLRPLCGHLLRCKGESYIRKVRQTFGEPVDVSEVEEEENHASLSFQTLNKVTRAMEINSVSIEAAQEFICDEDALNRAVSYLVSQGKLCFSALDIVHTAQEFNGYSTQVVEDDVDVREKLQDNNEELRQPLT